MTAQPTASAPARETKQAPPQKSRRRRRRRPIHLFRYKDRNYVLDIGTSTYLELDETAYEVLRACKHFDGRDRGAVQTKLADRFTADTLSSVLSEMETLGSAGLFRGDPPETEADIDRYLRRLTRRTSVNLTLSVSQACNLACKYCYGDCGSYGLAPQLMDKATARRSVDFLFRRAEGAEEVGLIFFGGEPLLNYEVIRDAVDYSQALGKEQGKKVAYSLTTNGTLLNEEINEFLVRNRFGLLVSLDGPPEIHDAMRPFKNGEGSFDVVAPKLLRLLERRGSLSVRPTLTRDNLETQQISDFLDEMGFTRIGFGVASGTCYQKDALDLDRGDLVRLHRQEVGTAEHILEQLSLGRRVKYNPWAGLLSNIHEQRRTRVRCGLGRGNSTVAADGRIYPCHRYVGMEAFVTGDIDNGIDSERVRKLLTDYYRVRQYCRDTCWAHNICGGPCPAYVAHPDGVHLDPDPGHCHTIRKSFEAGIWLYLELRDRFPHYLERVVGAEAGSLTQAPEERR